MQPFEEVVGMPRVPPQAGTAGPALVGRIGAEACQLAVGQCFTAHTQQPYGHGRQQPGRQARARMGGSGHKGQGEHGHQKRLRHEEAEDPPLITLPVLAQVAVAPVLAFMAHAMPQVQREPAAPQAAKHTQSYPWRQRAVTQHRQQQGRCAYAFGPQHIDHADVAVATLPGPAPAHDQHRIQQHPQQRAHGDTPASGGVAAAQRRAARHSTDSAMLQPAPSSSTPRQAGAMNCTAPKPRAAER